MNQQPRPLGLRTSRDIVEALNGLPVPAYVFDTETMRFLAANGKFEGLLGHTEAELREMTIEDIRPQQDVVPLRDRVKRQPPAGLVPTQYFKKDGTMLDIKVHYRDVAYSDDAGATVNARLVVVEFWKAAAL